MKKVATSTAGEGYILIACEIVAEKCKCCRHHELCIDDFEGEGQIAVKPKDIIEITLTESEYERRVKKDNG